LTPLTPFEAPMCNSFKTSWTLPPCKDTTINDSYFVTNPYPLLLLL
jgi:hypothetical protein